MGLGRAGWFNSGSPLNAPQRSCGGVYFALVDEKFPKHVIVLISFNFATSNLIVFS